mgnify:FL=1
MDVKMALLMDIDVKKMKNGVYFLAKFEPILVKFYQKLPESLLK